ncbi:MAG: phosphoribosylamine--glycine ligase [Anaerolineales bacterium]|nr:phosphoribosylamine--glycine ligase [Anaerolineales bacterium]
MNILLIGSGGREHAIAWKLSQSPKLGKLYIAPGNAGAALHGENLDIRAADHEAVLRAAREKSIDLVLVGPEVPLAAGLADDLLAAGIKVFGPVRAAARIEASKVFSKEFMDRHGIPTARFASFRSYAAALKHLQEVDYPVVIKASGLAAGKGVLIPDTDQQAEAALHQLMVAQEFGEAGDQVVIEEKLSGPEVSLLAFSDGTTVKPMTPSQDHKRALEGDQGLNTGGMGAYAPVPVCPPEMVGQLMQTVVQPAVDGLRAEGNPFVGVLYAGMMLTVNGPRVIEFNCRFGDPETQVVLPLLESDLVEVALACAEGNLDQVDVTVKDGAAACVVMASGGYPGDYRTGYPITGLDNQTRNSFVFHAGTRLAGGRVVTSGGRVLCVTGWGEDIRSALEAAYERIRTIDFKDAHYRKDIGWRVLEGER